MAGAGSASQAIALGHSTWEIIGVGNFAGHSNGTADLLWENTSTDAILACYTGGGYLSLGKAPAGCTFDGVGDFNGDGTADLLWQNTSSGVVFAAITGGSDLTLGTVPSGWMFAGIGDFNGDGKADVLWQNTSSGEMLVWFTGGGGQDLGTVPLNSGWTLDGIGDFNGDGKADLAWQNTSSGVVMAWITNGGGVDLGTVPSGWTFAGIGDFNGDGTADLLWQNTSSGEMLVWITGGNGLNLGTVPVNSGWTLAGIADFNGDKVADLAWQNSSSAEVLAWYTGGGGQLLYSMPIVTTNPTNQTVNANGTATFTAAADPNLPVPTVQWEVSTSGATAFAPISGATATTYSFTATSTQNGNQYEAVFSNSILSPVTTTPATLAVDYVETQPSSQTVDSTYTATFTAATSNPGGNDTVQWDVSTNGGATFSPITGATATTYSFPAAAAQNGYQYEAVFHNSAGTFTSNPATLTVDYAPTVITNPNNQLVGVGGTTTFTATASGNPTPTVQWELNTGSGFTNLRDTGVYSGSRTDTLTITGATASMNGYRYEAVFTNTLGTFASNPATLTVGNAPVVTTNPTSQAVNSGGTASFTVLASGSPTPTVQWEVNAGSGFTNLSDGGVYSGSSTDTLTITGATATMNNYQYEAVFSNGILPAATTTAATLVVQTGLAAPAAFAPDTTPDVSDADVVYADGDTAVAANDLGLGITRSYSAQLAVAQTAGALPLAGYGWMLADQPYVTQTAQGLTCVVFSPQQAYWFQGGAWGYSPMYGAQETLTLSSTSHLFSLVMPDGTVYQFRDFSYGNASNGQFAGMYSPGGAATVATFNANGTTGSINYYVGGAYNFTNGTGTPYQSEVFAYTAAGQVASITLMDENGVSARSAVYSYYGTGDANGQPGDLEAATETALNSSGTMVVVGSYYYRYYTSGSGLLEDALTPQEVQNVVGSNVSGSTVAQYVANLLSYLDTYGAVHSYAADYFQYGANNRVSQSVIDGLYTYQYTYATSSNTQNYDNWQTETIESRYGSGSVAAATYTVFTNFAGETLLTDLYDTTFGEHWVTDQTYGLISQSYEQGLLLQSAQPSAVDVAAVDGYDQYSNPEYGYNSANASLAVQFNPTGLIAVYTYSSATTAGETTAGNVQGYLESETLDDGNTTSVPVESYAYYAHVGSVATADGTLISVNVFPTASDSTYPNAPGDMTPDTTSYTYSWWNVPNTSTPSAQVQQETTTLPVVSVEQNGSGNATTELDYFNVNGTLQWEQDGDAFLTYHAYDAVTGLEIETVADAGSGSGLSSVLPPGWSFPDVGVNATTNYQYDSLGRLTQTLGPAFLDAAGATVRTASWTSYVDNPVTLPTGVGAPYPLPSGEGQGWQGTEVLTGSGYATVVAGSITGFTLVNPISITISDLDGNVTDEIEAVAGPGITSQAQAEDGSHELVVSSTQPNLGSYNQQYSLDQNNATWCSWTHDLYDPKSGQLTEELDYTDIADGVYLTTQYAYDCMGRVAGTMDPSGTIDATTYDARGLALSESVGTAKNNMVTTVLYTYDNGQGGGDGNLTSMTENVDGNIDDANARTTYYGYDWRDRQLWTLVDDHTPTSSTNPQTRETYTYNTYDNLDDVTNVTRYWAATDWSGPSWQPATGTDKVIGRSGAAYDSLGDVYQTLSYNQNGTVAIVSNTFFDGDGNVIMTQDGGTQEFTKTVYDGLGDPLTVYDGYDSSPPALGTSAAYAEAQGVSASDVILSQTDTTYDAAGDATFTTDYQRSPYAAATAYGGLDTLGASDSLVSYTADWYDGIGRNIAEADYGTNGGGAPTVYASAPFWNGTAWQQYNGTTDVAVGAMVSGTAYDARGEDYLDTDSAGIQTRTIYDDDGRTTSVIKNYTGNGAITPATPADQNLTTETFYSQETPVASTDVLEPNTQGQTSSFSAETFVPVGTQAAGTVYLMYAPDAADLPMVVAQTSYQVVAVTYGSQGWQYCNDNSQYGPVPQNGGWAPFTPRADDVLVAQVNAGSITTLQGQSGTLHGLQYGYVGSTFSTAPVSGYALAGFSIAAGSIEPNATAEVTSYVYGTSADGTPALYSNDLVAAEIPPDSSNRWLPQTGQVGNTTGGYDRIQYTYDLQGEMTSMEDQNQTTHQYAYDGVGHLLSDSISSFGAGVDTTVASIDYAYKVCGKLLSVSSEDSSGDVLNEVYYQYDSNGNLVAEYQEQNGAVNTADLSATLSVGYGYDDTTTTTASGLVVSDTGYRPTTLEYPSTGGATTTRTLNYYYGDSEDPGGVTNRIGSIWDGATTSGVVTVGAELDSYMYLGADTISADYYAQPNVGYDLMASTRTASGTQSNLDQYGRVADMVWENYGNDSTLDGYQYTYNPQGDVATKHNLAPGAPNLDEAYTYDQLDQLTSLTRGKLVDQVMSDTDFTQSWTLNGQSTGTSAIDGLGNWENFSETSTTNPSLDQAQTRTPSAGNEIQNITTTSGALTWITPQYDNAGNMTTTPMPGNESTGLTCTYDAWNRLVSVIGAGIDEQYVYDGLNRLIETNSVDDSPQTVTHYYYAGDQLLETRVATGPGAAEVHGDTLSPQNQYVWSAASTDAPMLRDTYVSGTLVPADRLYYLTDANGNVTAVVGDATSSWQVAERYVYDAYGHVTMYDGPGGGTHVDWGNPQHTVSSQGNTILYAGMDADPATGLYYDNARWYNSSTGGFLTRDPALSTSNLYCYCGNDPIGESDPSGLQIGGGSVGGTAPGNGPRAPVCPGPTFNCSVGADSQEGPTSQNLSDWLTNQLAAAKGASKQAITDAVTSAAEKIFNFMQAHDKELSDPQFIDTVNAIAQQAKTLAKMAIDTNPSTMGWLDLTFAWYFELGGVLDEGAKDPTERIPQFTFDGKAKIIQDIKALDGVKQIIADARAAYKNLNGRHPATIEIDRDITFRVPQFWDSLAKVDKAFLFLGSYHCKASYGSGDLMITVTNTTGWQSGTRFRRGNKGILEDRKRGSPGIQLGGNIKQTFRFEVPWDQEDN
jgi:RHS repeat-associated protein